MSASDAVARRVRAPPHHSRADGLSACRACGGRGLLRGGGLALAEVAARGGVRLASRRRRIAALYLGGPAWPGVLLATCCNDYGAIPVGTALLQTCGNLLEILIAAILLRRIARAGRRWQHRRVDGMLGALPPAAVSATVGSLAQLAGGVIGPTSCVVWRTWWLGTSPARSCWSRSPSPGRGRRRAVVVARGRGGGTAAHPGRSAGSPPRATGRLPSWCSPLLIWAALRFGTYGATAAVARGRRDHGLEHLELRRPVRVLLGQRGRDQHPAVIAVAAPDHVLPRGRRRRARGVQRGSARVARPPGRGVRHRAAQDQRNLHDGAQQRLSAIAVHLRLAPTARPAGGDAALMCAPARSCRSPSRSCASSCTHCRRPAGQAGLRARSAASPSLVVPVTLLGLPCSRLDDTAEATAYYVIAEAVTNAPRYTRADSIEVSAVVSHRVLDVAVSDDGIGGASRADELRAAGAARPRRGDRRHDRVPEPPRPRNRVRLHPRDDTSSGSLALGNALTQWERPDDDGRGSRRAVRRVHAAEAEVASRVSIASPWRAAGR